MVMGMDNSKKVGSRIRRESLRVGRLGPKSRLRHLLIAGFASGFLRRDSLLEAMFETTPVKTRRL